MANPTDLSFIIDPGGLPGVRPGINLQVFPDGNVPLTLNTSESDSSSRSANGRLLSGGYSEFYSFSFEAMVTAAEYQKLKALYRWSLSRREQSLSFEIVIYQLAEPFTELSATRTRYKVPGTNVISQVALDGSPVVYEWCYWIALQGMLKVTGEQVGECYRCKFDFVEGSKLLSSQE
jgi:hypothetical protein